MQNRFNPTYHKTLKSVLKPTRYLGNELNAVIKDWTAQHMKIALCFPDTYEIGMSHLGLKILYHYLNKTDGWCAERVYMPWVDMIEQLRENQLPLFSLENKKALNQFDIVGFSLQYELEYTNVLEMLDLGSIPVFSKDRGEEDPIVIAGGPVVFNPEPMADFLDAFLIGDGEEAFAEVIRIIEKCKAQDFSRDEILKTITKVDGVYVPSLYESEIDSAHKLMVVKNAISENVPFPVRRSLLEDINRFPFPEKIIVPFGRIIHDRVAVELARGCTQGCRFCQAGTIYRPVRERDPKSVIETIRHSIEQTGYDEASLTSLSSADYSGIELLAEKLMDDLEEQETALSISSLRVYGITETLAKQIARVRKTGFTVAPEAGSQRLRDIINKGISEEDILTGVSNAFDQGWNLIKLYLMIGLPGEEDEDIQGIVDLAKKILAIGRGKIGKKVKLNVSINTFIPKPHTPFQWSGVLSEAQVRQRKKMILDGIKNDKAISLSFNDFRQTRLEVILSRGDRRLGKLIYSAWKRGAILDAWMEHFIPQIWQDAMAETGIDADPYLSSFSTEAPLPWDHVDTLVQKEFLLREYNRSLQELVTLPCEQPIIKSAGEKVDKILAGTNFVCYKCGVGCDLMDISHQRIDNIKYLKKSLQSLNAPENESNREEEIQYWNYKIIYAKTGEMQFVSQLDMIKLLTHAMRKTGIPIARSQGFNPRPKFWFASSLGVGIEGLNERMGIRTTAKLDEKLSLQKLNQVLPRGLVFKSLELLNKEALKSAKQVQEKSYRFFLEKGNSELKKIESRIALTMAKKSIPMDRIVKKKHRHVEVRPLIKEVFLDKNEAWLDVICYETDTAGVRPEQLVKLFIDRDISEIRVQRLSIK